MATADIYYINLGGGLANVGAVRYAFYARKDSYKNIGGDLGVVKARDTDRGLMFGCNSPKPVRVRLRLKNGKSIIRFCEPDKVNRVTIGGALNGKKYNGVDIEKVTVVQG